MNHLITWHDFLLQKSMLQLAFKSVCTDRGKKHSWHFNYWNLSACLFCCQDRVLLKPFRDIQQNTVSSQSSAYPESAQIPIKQPTLTQGNGMDTLTGLWLSKVASEMSPASLAEFSHHRASGRKAEWSGSDRQLLYLISLGRGKEPLFGFEHSESQAGSTVTTAFYPPSSNCYPSSRLLQPRLLRAASSYNPN